MSDKYYISKIFIIDYASRGNLIRTRLQEAFQRAKEYIILNRFSQNLVLLINENKIKKLSNKNEKELKKLARLGVINLYMDNTVSLSKMGKNLVRVIRYIHSL